MVTNRIVMMLLCCMSFMYCSNGGSDSDGRMPAMSLGIESSGETSVTLSVKTINATYVRILCIPTSDIASQTAQSVFEKGKKYTDSEVVIDDLLTRTNYTVFAVACDDTGKYGVLQYVQFATDGADPVMYSWEQQRSGILSFSDLVLCYGGSKHRSPYLWNKDRFQPFVTYVDQQGKEHWLFDSFLCIEFQTLNSSYMVGLKLPSAGKTQWQELIDYWFAKDNGVNALDAAVQGAAQRLGTPPTKRKVVMTMPDPIIYKMYNNTQESTTYWGELNGRKMDFSRAKDRIAVYQWYIDQVRKKFDEANYKYIELAGFYIISEDLATPKFGWNPELKKSDEIIPPTAKYLHKLNEALCWIPYNRASGYQHWKELGIDYAYMQPNHFWDDEGTKPLSRFFSDILANKLAMEFEFDEALIDGKANCEVYKKRFREYMSQAKGNGIYGSKPLSYYHGTNGFYELWASQAAKDRELYHEFCQFVINNPLRK